MPCAHAFHGLCRAGKTAEHIDAHHAFEPLPRHVFHAAGHIDHACVVDQPCDAAHGLIDLVEQPDDVCFYADIGLKGLCLATVGLDL